MIHPMRRKVFAVTPPQAIVDNASWTTGEIDTLGADFLVVNILLGATDIAMTELKLTESDTAGSGHTDVPGTVFGTDNNDTGSPSTLPSATDDNKFFTFHVDLRGRKRYLDLVATAGDGAAGTYLAAWAELWWNASAPRLGSEAGEGQRMVA